MDGPAYLPDQPPGMEGFLAWSPQPIPILPLVGAFLAVTYLWGMWLLWRRRISWPWWRAALFLTRLRRSGRTDW